MRRGYDDARSASAGADRTAVDRKTFSFDGLWRKPLGHFVRGGCSLRLHRACRRSVSGQEPNEAAVEFIWSEQGFARRDDVPSVAVELENRPTNVARE
jgi:hypothetical protein